VTAEPIKPDQELSISAARDQLSYLVPAYLTEATEHTEEAADVAVAREALARIDAGEKPISLSDLRAELGL